MYLIKQSKQMPKFFYDENVAKMGGKLSFNPSIALTSFHRILFDIVYNK
jgi:hypothetical protein